MPESAARTPVPSASVKLDRSRLQRLGSGHAAADVEILHLKPFVAIKIFLLGDIVRDVAEGQRRMSDKDFLGESSLRIPAINAAIMPTASKTMQVREPLSMIFLR